MNRVVVDKKFQNLCYLFYDVIMQIYIIILFDDPFLIHSVCFCHDHFLKNDTTAMLNSLYWFVRFFFIHKIFIFKVLCFCNSIFPVIFSFYS